MLVLTRKIREQIQIGDDITVTILRMKGQAVRVGIEAPQTMRIVRGELWRRLGPSELGRDQDHSSHESSDPGPSTNDASDSGPAGSGPIDRTGPVPDQGRVPPALEGPTVGPPPTPRAPTESHRHAESPLLAIANRRLRRRRSRFIPEGRM